MYIYIYIYSTKRIKCDKWNKCIKIILLRFFIKSYVTLVKLPNGVSLIVTLTTPSKAPFPGVMTQGKMDSMFCVCFLFYSGIFVLLIFVFLFLICFF